MVNRTRCASIVLVILGIGFIIASVLLFILGDSLINNAVKKGCELRDGTPAYDNWRHPAVPLRLTFYVFDLNGTDFLTNNNSKPNLIQRGPFVYKEIRTKVDVETYDNGTISYHEFRNYTFDRQASCLECDETMNITTFNIVYMAIVNLFQTEHIDPVIRRIVGEILSYVEQPIMQRTVKEFLWGYEDSILKFIEKEFPDFVSNDQVSVYYASVSQAGLNTFLINSGVDVHNNNSQRIKQVGNIEGFNYQTKLSYWSDDYANTINGTDSTIWHPDATSNDDVYIFQSDICRSFHLKYQETRKNNFGTENHRFVLPSTTFTRDNQGFCLNSTTDRQTYNLTCLPNGLMSLKTCIKLSGSAISVPLPIIASFPHFLDADPIVQNAVKGLKPDETIHRSFMDIEPITGTVMNGSRRMQVNLNVINDSQITPIKYLQPFVYPMIWLDEHAEIDKPNSDKFRSKVIVPMTVVEAMKYVTLAIGGILFIIVVILIVRNHHETKSTGDAFPPVAPDESAPLLW